MSEVQRKYKNIHNTEKAQKREKVNGKDKKHKKHRAAYYTVQTEKYEQYCSNKWTARTVVKWILKDDTEGSETTSLDNEFHTLTTRLEK